MRCSGPVDAAFDREFCADLNVSAQREWLVTNGLGGFASGSSVLST